MSQGTSLIDIRTFQFIVLIEEIMSGQRMRGWIPRRYVVKRNDSTDNGSNSNSGGVSQLKKRKK